MENDNMKMEVTEMDVENAMKNTFFKMMRIEQPGRHRWLGTAADLVELVHLMWLNGLTIDEQGNLLCFTHTVNRLCQRLSVKPPTNATAVMNNIKRRKNLDRLLVVRCRRMMEQGERRPLGRLIRATPGNPEKSLPLPTLQKEGRIS